MLSNFYFYYFFNILSYLTYFYYYFFYYLLTLIYYYFYYFNNIADLINLPFLVLRSILLYYCNNHSNDFYDNYSKLYYILFIWLKK